MPPTSADDAFASLMAAEETFKKDFKARSAGTSLSSQQTSVKRLPSVKTVSDHELRRLGLPGAEQQQHPARRAPPPPPAPPPMPAPVLAPAPAPAPAAAVPDRLATVLAARKAQVSVAKHTELLGLRSAGEVDSDDDDDGAVCDAPGLSGAAAPGAASGKTEKARKDLDAALGAIRARTLVMPCTTDLYFQVADNAIEVPKMPNAELRPIVSDWGHRAGNPQLSPPDEAVLRDAVAELLAG